MRLTKLSIIVGLILIYGLANGQERKSAKLIQSMGDYIHRSTAMLFPEQIEDYKRKSIYSFTKTEDNIDVTYEKPGSTSVAINIYPAGYANEGRLRNEYLKVFRPLQIKQIKLLGSNKIRFAE
ncbi:hypothetical protein [Niabella hibiscisoli]|uniref:hypothetical protein n=1 Tax=Niabella hibiscisoli TaxID=1825928 RepID=UPI001F11087D|nr:hypothetical protein [Niabella hibiscisoli]MCH5720551.1 hypothetical protein [Niabella hibiscisoli]